MAVSSTSVRLSNAVEWLCVGLLYTLITLWFTNPLWRHPGSYLVDPGDPLEHVAISWWLSRRVLAGHLAGIWDLPPIFYPAHLTLTYTDPQIGVTLLGLPVYALTHNILAAYNFVVLISFPLCALGAYALARHLTRSRGAALLAGVIWAFSAWSGGQASHQQLLSIEALPWVLLCLHRYAETRRNRYLVGIFFWWVVQEYLCEYWGMFLILLIGPFALFLLRYTARLRGRDLVKPLAAIALAIAAWMPTQWLFLVTARQGHNHSDAMVNLFSAQLSDYLPTVQSFRGIAGAGERAVYLGLAALALAAIGVGGLLRLVRCDPRPLSPFAERAGRIAARIAPLGLIFGGVATVAMAMLGTNDLGYFGLPMAIFNQGVMTRVLLVSVALGFNQPLVVAARRYRLTVRDPRSAFLPYLALALLAIIWSCGYAIRYEGIWIAPGIHGLLSWLPGAHSFRVLARMGAFADLALSILAAAGYAVCLRHASRRGFPPAARAGITAALCALTLLESVPVNGTRFARASACLPPARRADTWLAAHGREPLVELPLGVDETFRMGRQIYHQHPTMNGYATFSRPGFGADERLLDRPQSPATIRRLRDLGVRYVLLDLPQASGLLAPYRLRLHDTEVDVYELPP